MAIIWIVKTNYVGYNQAITMETASTTFERVLALVASDQIRISEHGYDELAADDILVQDILNGITNAVIVEDYPNYH